MRYLIRGHRTVAIQIATSRDRRCDGAPYVSWYVCQLRCEWYDASVKKAHLRRGAYSKRDIPIRRASDSHWEGWADRMLWNVFGYEDAALRWAVVVGGRGRHSCGLKCAADQKDDYGIAWENVYLK
jgi:hypothetical protein